MKLITIQSKTVLDILMRNEVYRANYQLTAENHKNPYRKMSEHYGWDSCPIFCAPMGKNVLIESSSNDVAIELDVPDEIVKLQYYFDWSDFIYFTEFPDEYADTFNTSIYPTIDDFAKDMFACKNLGSYDIFQATIPRIEPTWMVAHSLSAPMQILRDARAAYQRVKPLSEYSIGKDI